MADSSPNRKPRPISPHLQIWRWGPAMAVSILHRATGSALALAGLGTLLCWLGALVAGPEAYGKFVGLAGSPLGLLVLVGISWTAFNHLASGVRHLIMDIGAGFELEANAKWSTLTPVIGLALTALFWAALLHH